MNTLIAEQASEIAILKTLGGRRRQIGGIILRTAAMLGAAGAVVGHHHRHRHRLPAGALLRRDDHRRVRSASASPPVVVASLLLGPALAVAASLPALRRALRRPVADTLAGTGHRGFGAGRLDRLVARSGLLSGTRVPGSVRMGVRNVLRQKRRSAAAIAQVAVAAGLAITFLALGQSVTAADQPDRRPAPLQLRAGGHRTSGARPFGSQALGVAAWTPGVTGGRARRDQLRAVQRADLRGVGPGRAPLYAYRLSAGHWFTAAETAAGARTAVRRWCSAPRSRAPPAPGSARSSPSTCPRDTPTSASSGSTPAQINTATPSTSRGPRWNAWTAGPAPRTRSGSPPPVPATPPSTGRRPPPRAG